MFWILVRLLKGRNKLHCCWNPKKFACPTSIGPCLKYSQVECKSWQLCCIHFQIRKQVSCKGWLCPLFLWWWLLYFEKHQVLLGELQLQNSLEVCDYQQYASCKSWILKWKGKCYLNSTKAFCFRVNSILTYLSICQILSWARCF